MCRDLTIGQFSVLQTYCFVYGFWIEQALTLLYYVRAVCKNIWHNLLVMGGGLEQFSGSPSRIYPWISSLVHNHLLRCVTHDHILSHYSLIDVILLHVLETTWFMIRWGRYRLLLLLLLQTQYACNVLRSGRLRCTAPGIHDCGLTRMLHSLYGSEYEFAWMLILYKQLDNVLVLDLDGNGGVQNKFQTVNLFLLDLSQIKCLLSTFPHLF